MSCPVLPKWQRKMNGIIIVYDYIGEMCVFEHNRDYVK